MNAPHDKKEAAAGVSDEMVERVGEILFKDWSHNDRNEDGPYGYWRERIREALNNIAALALPSASPVGDGIASDVLDRYLANNPGDHWPPERARELRVEAMRNAINNAIAAAPLPADGLRGLVQKWRALGGREYRNPNSDITNERGRTRMQLADELEAALSTPIAQGEAAAGWQPIATAPEGELVVVFTPYDDGRMGFDVLEDGVWLQHADNYEHYMIVGGPNAIPGEVCIGPSEEAPYTHWMPIPPTPSNQSPSLAVGQENGNG